MGPEAEALEGSTFKPLWLDQPARPARLPALTGSRSCELLIVGGGFTGLWAALQAKERRPDLDIILIEGTEVGDGASGRNGGFLSSSLAHGANNTDFHFPGEQDTLYDLGRQNMDEFMASLERYGIDARYEGTGEIEINTRPDQDEGMAEWVEEERADGYDLVWLDREEMQAEVHSPTYWGGLWDREGHDGLVDPAYLCWGLKKTIQELGVRIFDGTPMRGLDRQGEGMAIECPSGRIRARKVLLATNAFRNPIRSARRRVIPIWDYVIATEPLTPDQMKSIGWERRQGLGNNANMFHYYRLTHDNRIVWGGWRQRRLLLRKPYPWIRGGLAKALRTQRLGFLSHLSPTQGRPLQSPLERRHCFDHPLLHEPWGRLRRTSGLVGGLYGVGCGSQPFRCPNWPRTTRLRPDGDSGSAIRSAASDRLAPRASALGCGDPDAQGNGPSGPKQGKAESVAQDAGPSRVGIRLLGSSSRASRSTRYRQGEGRAIRVASCRNRRRGCGL